MNDLYEKERQEKLAAMQQSGNCANALRPMTTQEMQDDVLRRTLKRLDYHPPSGEQVAHYQALRDAAKAFTTVILRNCPLHSQEAKDAIRGVEVTLMLANKAIALETD